MVRDLAPSELADGDSASVLAAALQRVAGRAPAGPPVEVRVDGDPVQVPPEVAAALVRTARGALANVHEHALARRVALTLTYHRDAVVLDVRDDGRGFDPGQVHGNGIRGHGLAGIRQRAAALGGLAHVESTPGEGATVSVRFPLSTEGGGR